MPKPEPSVLGWQRQAHAPCQVCLVRSTGTAGWGHTRLHLCRSLQQVGASCRDPGFPLLPAESSRKGEAWICRHAASELESLAQHLSPSRCQQVPGEVGSPQPVTVAQAGSQLCLPQGTGTVPEWFIAMWARQEHPGWPEHPALSLSIQAGITTHADTKHLAWP